MKKIADKCHAKWLSYGGKCVLDRQQQGEMGKKPRAHLMRY